MEIATSFCVKVKKNKIFRRYIYEIMKLFTRKGDVLMYICPDCGHQQDHPGPCDVCDTSSYVVTK